MFTDPLTERLAGFVRSIGIEVRAATLDGPTFFPGVDIQYGAILIDEPRQVAARGVESFPHRLHWVY